MSMSRRPPETGVIPLRDVFDRWFREPFLALGSQWEGEGSPAVDVREENDRYIVEAEIPGVRPEDTEVTLDGRTLTIQARFGKDEERRQEGNFLVRERRRGSMTRVITLPVAVDPEQVSCTYENGELRITVPKSAQSRARRIPVTSGGTGTGSAGTGSADTGSAGTGSASGIAASTTTPGGAGGQGTTGTPTTGSTSG